MSDLCVCMRDVISEFNSDIEGSHTYCALTLFMCSFLCLMCSGSSFHVECVLPFGMLCLSVCVENDVCEDGVCSVYIWWGLNIRESILLVCSEWGPDCLPIVRECMSVLL